MLYLQRLRRNLRHIIVADLRHDMRQTTTFSGHVLHIVMPCTKKKMVWTHAYPDVLVMATEQSGQDETISEFIGEAVCFDSLCGAETEGSIARRATTSLPEPAGVCLEHMRPEPFSRRHQRRHHHLLTDECESSNSRSILKILYNLCRKTLSAPFCAPCIAFDATCTARIEARREAPQLWLSIEAEFRHGHGTKGATCLELRGALTGIDRQGGS